MRLELGITTYPFFQSPPTSAPSLSWAKQRFFGAPPNLNLNWLGAVRLQAKNPIRTVNPPVASPLFPLPTPPSNPALGAQSPLGPGWQPKPEPPPRRGLEREPAGGCGAAPAPARPWAGVSGRQWLRQQRLADREGEKQGRRWAAAQSPGTPALPIVSPRDPLPGGPPRPRQLRTQVAHLPHPNPGHGIAPHSRAPREGAGGRGPGGGGAGWRSPPFPARLTLRAGGLRRRLAGSAGGAAEQQPQQR